MKKESKNNSEKFSKQVTNVDELKNLLVDVREAQREFSTYSQEQVDEIFKNVAMKANAARIPLAQLTVEDTGMGDVEDKVIKNHFAAEHVYNSYKDSKTCGLIEEDKANGFYKVAAPVGVVSAIIPSTNPTSTVIYKALICLKTRNAMVISPHPGAKECTLEAARIVYEAAVEAGAPENIIAWIDQPTLEMSQTLMAESDLVLATGGPGMVGAAYSSGKPALGVGPGNTPAIIDESADLKMAVDSIIVSKTFDNGMICASEESVIIHEKVYDQVIELFKERSCHFLDEKEIEKSRKTLVREGGGANPEQVGKNAATVAEVLGVNVPEHTKLIMAEVTDPSANEPWSTEKLSPTLAVFKAKDIDHAIDLAEELVEHGGKGHTSSMFVDELRHPERIQALTERIKTARILINTPASQGGIGDLFNFRLEPSMTLGCGTWGRNSVSENIGIKHLLNIKSVAIRRDNMLWFRVPEKVYFKYASLDYALKEIADMGRKRAFIVTDADLANLGFDDIVGDVLRENGMDVKVFSEVEPDPTIAIAKKGVEAMQDFKPDTIIGLGGGSPMDAAKIMQVMYEYPEVDFQDLALRFSDIRKRVYGFPKLGKDTYMVSIATTAGTGSEVTPFTIITDEKTDIKYSLADYELTPDMAIVDPALMMNLPKGTTAISGIDALTHALESYVSTMATPYTDSLGEGAAKLIFEYLPRAYNDGPNDREAREQMSNASSMAGMAFANAFLGVCHSCAHKLGAHHNVPHGLANSLLIKEVIKYNSDEDPRRQAAFSQHRYTDTKAKYAQFARALGLEGKNDDELVESLLDAITNLQEQVDMPMTVSEYGIDKKAYFDSIDTMAVEAFDDQCTGTNPRYPSIDELKEIFRKIW